jgi:hypothetical protein
LSDELLGSQHGKLTGLNTNAQVRCDPGFPIFFKVGLVIRGPISEAQEPKNDHRKDAQGQNQRSDQALAGRFVQEESRCGVPWHSFEMYQKIRSQIKLKWGIRTIRSVRDFRA